MQKLVQCVLLNACDSEPLARALIARSTRDELSVVCWTSQVLDAAAREFTHGFLAEVGGALRDEDGLPLPVRSLPATLPIDAAFRSACAHFASLGYRFGDPKEHLHAPEHEHVRGHSREHGSIVLHDTFAIAMLCSSVL